MRSLFTLALVFLASRGFGAIYAGAILSLSTNGEIVSPTNFLPVTFLAGSNVVVEFTNGHAAMRIHVPVIGTVSGGVDVQTNTVLALANVASINLIPGANVTFSVTNRAGTTDVQIAASLTGGGATMSDVTNVVVSYVTPNATNVFVVAGTWLTNEINSLKDMTNQFAKVTAVTYLSNEVSAIKGMSNSYVLAGWTNYARTNFVGASYEATPLKVVGTGSVTVSSNLGTYTVSYSGSGITLADVTNGAPLAFDDTIGAAGDVNAAGTLRAGATNVAEALHNINQNTNSWVLLSVLNASSNALYIVSSNITINFTLGASNELYTTSSNIAQAKVNSASNTLYTTSSNVAQSLVNNASNNLYTTSSNIAQAKVNTASNALYTTSSNVSQALVNSGSNALYTTSSNIAEALALSKANAASNSLYTVSSNIAINFALGASNSLYTVSSNVSQGLTDASSNSLYTVSSNISQALADSSSNALYTVSSNVAINFTLGASNSLYTVSSNISQALVDSGSNALYTISSNVSQALVDAGSNSLYTVSSNVSQALVNSGSNSLYTVSSNVAQALVNAGSNSLYTVSSNVSEALALSKANAASNALYTVSSNIAVNYANGTTNANFVVQAELTACSNTLYSAIGSGGAPPIVTNSIWVPAGAMAPGGGTTADGGRNGGTAGSYTNGALATDTWDLDDTTNECVTFNWQPGAGFTGEVAPSFYWLTTNALNGASNVVWDVGVSCLNSNGLLTANVYQTNGAFRFWSSNSVQVAKLPVVTATGQTPDSLLTFRISRLGTNTSDAAVGDARLIGARIAFTRTNWIGGYP